MDGSFLPQILGTATLNEKGQLVIPVEARHKMGLSAGSRVVLMSSPRGNGLVLLKAEDVEEIVKGLTDALYKDKDNGNPNRKKENEQ